MHSDGNFKELQSLLTQNKQFAILCPIGIVTEISRNNNNSDNSWNCDSDKDMDKLVHSLSKLVLSQDNMVWLITLHEQQRFVEVLSIEHTGCSLSEANIIIDQSINELLQNIVEFPDWDLHNFLSVQLSQDDQGQCDHLVQTRSELQNELSSTPPRRTRRARLLNIVVDPIVNWIGSQTADQEIPKTIMDKMISNYPNYPIELLVLPTTDQGTPRVLVPKYVQQNLVM
jgi:hypothetical protein